MIEIGSGGGCVRGDNNGMGIFGEEGTEVGVGGIWSGGGRWDTEFLVGFNRMLEFMVTGLG